MPRKNLKKSTFVDFVNRKYRKELNLPPTAVKFYTWDDYAIFLYFEKFKQDDEKYYYALENDLEEYSNIQTGTPRERGDDNE